MVRHRSVATHGTWHVARGEGFAWLPQWSPLLFVSWGVMGAHGRPSAMPPLECVTSDLPLGSTPIPIHIWDPLVPHHLDMVV